MVLLPSPSSYHLLSTLQTFCRNGAWCSLTGEAAADVGSGRLRGGWADPAVGAVAGGVRPGRRASRPARCAGQAAVRAGRRAPAHVRSEEHTSELQSQFHLVCRLLLEKNKTSMP